MFLAISQPILDRFWWFRDRKLSKMCTSKVQYVMRRKTGCNQSKPVFFGFYIFTKTWQLATGLITNVGNWQLEKTGPWFSPVQSYVYFQSCRLDLRTLFAVLWSTSASSLAIGERPHLDPTPGLWEQERERERDGEWGSMWSCEGERIWRLCQERRWVVRPRSTSRFSLSSSSSNLCEQLDIYIFL